ncbi:MAG: hypothetical protein WC789_09330 [Lentisphaeria bacterium]
MSEAEIAAAVESAPAVRQSSSAATEAVQAIADVEALIRSGGTPDPDEAGDGAGQPGGDADDGADKAPAGESGKEAPAKSDKPAEPGKQPPAADDKPVTVQLWDTDRQKRDQEHANEVKRLQAEIESLKTRPAERETKPAEKPADSKAKGNLKSLQDKVKALATSEETTTEDWANLFSGVLLEVERLDSRDQDSGEVEKLKTTIAEMAAKQQQAEQTAGLNRAQEQLNATLERLDKEYAPQLRNKAVEIVKARLKEKGYTDENPAGLDTVEAYFEAAYAAVDRQSPELRKGAKPAKPAGKPQAVRPDPGTGGGGQPAPRSGRLRDVSGEMLRSGKFAT